MSIFFFFFKYDTNQTDKTQDRTKSGCNSNSGGNGCKSDVVMWNSWEVGGMATTVKYHYKWSTSWNWIHLQQTWSWHQNGQRGRYPSHHSGRQWQAEWDFKKDHVKFSVWSNPKHQYGLGSGHVIHLESSVPNNFMLHLHYCVQICFLQFKTETESRPPWCLKVWRK